MTPEKLTTLRKAKGLSISALAKELGISRNTLAAYEAGKRPIPAQTSMAVAFMFHNFKLITD